MMLFTVFWLLRRVQICSLISFQPQPGKMQVSSVCREWRQRDFDQRFFVKHIGRIQLKNPSHQSAPVESSVAKTVVFSFGEDCLKHASVLSHFLRERSETKVQCEFLMTSQRSGIQAPKLQLLDTADMVVVLVSDDYLASSQYRHELHIALCRQRAVRTNSLLCRFAHGTTRFIFIKCLGEVYFTKLI